MQGCGRVRRRGAVRAYAVAVLVRGGGLAEARGARRQVGQQLRHHLAQLVGRAVEQPTPGGCAGGNRHAAERERLKDRIMSQFHELDVVVVSMPSVSTPFDL